MSIPRSGAGQHLVAPCGFADGCGVPALRRYESPFAAPSFAQAIEWVEALGNGLDLAPLWWQVPYGHLGLPNVCDQYEDNRVDYVFDHPERFAAGGALGVAFGAGATCMTTPATDGGHFVTRAAEYYQNERPLLCGD